MSITMSSKGALALILAGLVLVAGCVGTENPEPTTNNTQDNQAGSNDSGDTNDTTDGNGVATVVAAPLHATTAEGVAAEPTGWAFFQPTASGLYIHVVATGLTPGEHGVHIHQNPACNPVNGTAAGGAGGHFNPGNSSHGDHAGDLLQNMVVGEDGTASFVVLRPNLNANQGDALSVLGRSLVVHARADDFQDVASAGARVMCGVIGSVPASEAPAFATADMKAVSADGVGATQGFADFVAFNGSVYVGLAALNLTAGEHGVHIHQNGACEPVNGTAAGAAGGHFNPGNASHGEHVGDLLKNMVVGEDGVGTFGTVRDNLVLDASATGIVGRSLVVHARADDFQDVASAGARVMCGVIATL